MVAIPGEGALGDVITEMETVILRREGDELVYKDKIRIPKRPMIGVIGVAPESGAVPNGTPGPHGGNMDCTLITAGNSVYFTVGVDGALFGAGDFTPRWAMERS
jgi:amidase